MKAHPNLAIGIAIGAAVGLLTSMVPFLGPFLAPIVAAAGIIIGAVAGHGLDKQMAGLTITNQGSALTIAQSIIEIAREFFVLMIDILKTVFEPQVL